MNKLRHSIFTRTVAFVIVIITLLITFFNITVCLFAIEQNLFYAEQHAVERKVYSFFAERAANDVRRYFEVMRRAENNDEYFNYYYNESELYKSKFSKDYSNIAFEITDSAGNSVFSNFEMPDYAYKYEISTSIYFLDSNIYSTLPTSPSLAYEYETEFFQEDYYINEDGSISLANPSEESEVFTITIFVPENIRLESDSFYFAASLIRAGLNYRSIIIPLTVIAVILCFACYFFILWSAGYVRNSKERKAGGLHRIPFDLTVVLFIGIGTLSVMLFIGFDIFLILFSFVLTILVMLLFETLAVRLRAHTLAKNNIISYIFKGIKKIFSLFTENIGLLWKAAIIVIAITAVDIIATEWMSQGIYYPFFLLKFIEIIAFLLICINLNTLQKGAKSIANGEITKKIEGPILIGEFKKNAKYLNSINEGVNKAVYERLKSESMKTELITNVSHDLKTPLTSIVNYIDLLKKTEIQDENAKNYIEIIDRQAQRLKKLTVDIVEASKAVTGNIEVHFERTVLNVMLSQVDGEYQEKLEKNNLFLVSNIPEEEIAVFADGRLLSRIIDNLMNNIYKYSMPNTRVYLSMQKQPNNTAKIIFKNISGEKLNISPEELTERFVRGDSARNTEGSGLGLSIAKSLTEIMNGSFEITIDGDLFKVEISFGIID